MGVALMCGGQCISRDVTLRPCLCEGFSGSTALAVSPASFYPSSSSSYAGAQLNHHRPRTVRRGSRRYQSRGCSRCQYETTELDRRISYNSGGRERMLTWGLPSSVPDKRASRIVCMAVSAL